jgi:hypothetical protein
MLNKYVLKAELDGDPLGRGYAGMSDAAAAADLNTAYRTRNLERMTSSQIFQAVDMTEWGALEVAEQDKITKILNWGELNPFGKEAQVFINVFGGGSNTLSALAAARVEAISRAQELGWRPVTEGDVAQARALS